MNGNKVNEAKVVLNLKLKFFSKIFEIKRAIVNCTELFRYDKQNMLHVIIVEVFF